MRFNSFLLTERRSKPISKSDAIDTLRLKCKTAVNSYINDPNSRIYRGIDDSHDFMLVDPSNHTRTSRNTSNYYTYLIDNSLYWKAYPKRSKSIICTTSKSQTRQYGYSFVVLPFDGATIAVAPSHDFWESFKNVYMDDFNASLVDMMKRLAIPFNDSTYSNIKKSFALFDRISEDELNGVKNAIIHSNWLKGYKSGDNLMDYINDLLNPKNNGFRLTKVGQGLPSKREVWTDSKCVLIHYHDEINDILEGI